MRQSRATAAAICGLVILTACAPAAGTATPTTPPSAPSPTPASPEIVPTSLRSDDTLTIWVPPQFAPDPDRSSGTILADRLQAFQEQNPDIQLVLRVKETEGMAGLLRTLMAASVAAPSAMPDIIALDQADLTSAVRSELTYPLEGFVPAPLAPEWYEHAQSVSIVEGIFHGLAFSSQAELFAYRTERYEGPPLNWNDVLAGPPNFLFPAADADAVFTLAQYLALGGELTDADGNPALDPSVLADVLAFYASARTSEVLPVSALAYETSDETFGALLQADASSALAPLDAFIRNQQGGVLSAIPFPTRSGSGTCFTDSWLWAIVTSDPERQSRAGELLAFLTEPAFLGPWTFALAALPPNKATLATWPEGAQSAIASRLVTTCVPRPTDSRLATYGPPLKAAVDAILSGGTTPDSAALDAAQSLQSP